MPAPVYKKKTLIKKPGGRPCLLTKAREAMFLKAIEEGMPLKHAALMAGLSYDTVNRWRKIGEAETAPIEYRQFCKALQRSDALAMRDLLGCIRQAAKKRDWKAAAWMLERRHPEEFGKQALEQGGTKEKPSYIPHEIDHEVLIRMKQQNGFMEIASDLGTILHEQREQDKLLKGITSKKCIQPKNT